MLLQCNHALLAKLAFDGYPIINIHTPRAVCLRPQQMQCTQMPFAVRLLVHTFRDLGETEDDSIDTFGKVDDELAEFKEPEKRPH